MTTLHAAYLKKDKVENKFVSQNQSPGFNDTSKFLFGEQQMQLSVIKQFGQKIRVLKRITPLLLVEVCLPVLLMNALNDVRDFWFLLFLLAFVEINTLTIDFVIWNYYGGKKVSTIWITETTIILLALYFLI